MMQFSSVHPNAKIAANVEIGPYCYIAENVEIGEGCVIGPQLQDISRCGDRRHSTGYEVFR